MRQSPNYCQIAVKDTLVIRAGLTTPEVRREGTIDCAKNKNEWEAAAAWSSSSVRAASW
jgi:hypothetical protein